MDWEEISKSNITMEFEKSERLAMAYTKFKYNNRTIDKYPDKPWDEIYFIYLTMEWIDKYQLNLGLALDFTRSKNNNGFF